MFRSANRKLLEDGAFDRDWYVSTYPDVSLSGIDPLSHYLRYGHRIGRDPNPRFSTAFFRNVLRLSQTQEPVSAAERFKHSNRAADETMVLLAASRLADEGRPELALALAKEWLPEHLSHTALLLEANAAVERSNEAAWLGNVNKYLSVQGVAPLKLVGEGSLFARLRADLSTPPVTDGPLVSIVMGAWNAVDTIELAVRSILAQSWQRLELIVVDDASTDGTWDKLQQLASESDRMRIFRNTMNSGPYLSKNIALTQARGEWITSHDADDWAHPERIERQVRYCLERNETACLSGMLRMAADGQFVRFNPIGGNVIDGACRNAFVSLMIDAQVMHGALGHWDQVKVGADSELLHRLERLRGTPVDTIPQVTMLCYDNPVGLTNSALLGHSETRGVSQHRRTYKKSFMKFHDSVGATDARLEFPQAMRRFPAPSEILTTAQNATALVQGHLAKGLKLRRDIEADVAIITNFAFQGGNTSSTLDEVNWFLARGLKVELIHTPTPRDITRGVAERVRPYGHLLTNWTRVGNLQADLVIIRHPVVATSPAFLSIAERISAQHTYMVVNNSCRLSDGRPAYDPAALEQALSGMQTANLTICPISQVVRAELVQAIECQSLSLTLSDRDWQPTMDVAAYSSPAKSTLGPVFTIGRHGRDGAEKWHPDEKALRSAYPGSSEFQVDILGGARNVVKTLGRLPDNWYVRPFGSVSPLEYLSQLDAFVYFPHPGLVEAFGRSVAEAMLARVPVILPTHFRATFDDLAFYAEPGQVAEIIRQLAKDDPGRMDFLEAVYQVVSSRLDPERIGERLQGTRFAIAKASDVPEQPAGHLPPEVSAWRDRILALAKKH